MIHRLNSKEASHQWNRIFANSNTPSRDWAKVSSISSFWCWSNVMVAVWPSDQAYAIGSMATSTVHWLIFELTRFINAMGAVDIFLAQLKADTFSGNSDKKGAT